MLKHIAAIAFIFICTSIAWMVLGGTIEYRTDSSDTRLKGRVQSNWGEPQSQVPPTAAYNCTVGPTAAPDPAKNSASSSRPSCPLLPLDSSKIHVTIHLDQRKKGLLWYSTYQNDFDGIYSFQNTSDSEQPVTFYLHFPAVRAVYDDLQMSLDDSPLATTSKDGYAVAKATLAPKSAPHLHVSYRSQGLDSWEYSFGESANSVKNFDLIVNTDFSGFDFGENTLAPTSERAVGSGRELTWSYTSLVSGFPVRIEMPQKLQPGPLAGRISFFAPVSLFFFFFVLFILCTIRGIELHPMNYFFLACTFFSFHLLLAYLVDHISVHAAFVICSAVSVFLLVSYLRLVVSTRFAIVEAGLIQFIYLVLFSYAFFFEGFTGLAITIGAILTLFIAMQMTARLRWADKFARSPA